MFESIIAIAQKINFSQQTRMNALLASNVLRRELLHSDIIKMFIDPHFDKDGQRLRFFLEAVGKKSLGRTRKNISLPKHVTKSRVPNVYVRREYENIDILITYRAKNNRPIAIIIENKIDAPDQDRQLERYISTMQDEGYNEVGSDIFPIYLSLTGKEPEQKSIGNYDIDNIIMCSYEEHIRSWLDECTLHEQDNYMKSNVTMYKEMVEVLMSDEKNKWEAVEAVFNAADIKEPKQLELLTDAVRRKAQVRFLQKLCGELSRRIKKLPRVSKYAYTSKASIERQAKASDEYGFSFQIAANLLWSVKFDWSNKKYFLFTGLQPIPEGEIDEEIRKKIIKAVMPKKYSHYKRNDDHWYIRSDTYDLEMSFRRDEETKNASVKDWEDWAHEYADYFYDNLVECCELAKSASK